MTTHDLLERIRIVLVKPSHPGNIGACARAMKTMGITDLVVVDPRFADALQQDDAIAMASGATDVLAGATIVQTTAQALEGVQHAIGLSARQRDLAPAIFGARDGVQWALGEIQRADHVKVALVFGPERTGLLNEDLLLCQRQIMIEANPAYSSLNLSQAVQVLCYECRQQAVALGARTVPASATALTSGVNVLSDTQELACGDDVERLFERMVGAMSAVDFLNPERPRKLVPRVKRLLVKAQLERVEIDLLHGFFSDVIRVAEGRLYPHERQRLQQSADQTPGSVNDAQ